MREKNSSPLGYYMLGTAALFLAGFLLLVILGAQTYRNTTGGQSGNAQTRALLAYVASVVRANDAAGAVYPAENPGPEETAVLVVEDGSGYASRIYRYQGYLVEDYAETSAPYDPENAMKIGETGRFGLEYHPEEAVLLVETDQGTARLHLRASAGGGGSR